MGLKIELFGLRLPLVEGRVDLARLIVEAAEREGVGIREGDVIVVTSKLVQKAAGRLVRLSSVRPGLKARLASALLGKDPVETELVMRCSRRVLAAIPTGFLAGLLRVISRDPTAAMEALRRVGCVLMVVTRTGLVASDAGLDYSNLPPGLASLLDADFDAEARELREAIRGITGKDVAVVISDTEFAPAGGRVGSIDIAVGSSGIHPVDRRFGGRDLYGRPKFGGVDLIADEACAAAALLMRQCDEGVPVVIIRGLEYERSEVGVGGLLLTRTPKTALGLIFKTALLSLIGKLLGLL